MGQIERQVEKQILEYLKLVGIFAWKAKTTGTFDPATKRFRTFNGLKGVSDILGILPDGQFLAIEVKRPKIGTSQKGYLSKEQKEFIENINKRNGLAFVARSVEDVRKHLGGI